MSTPIKPKIIKKYSNEDLINELRCLRMQLTPLLNPKKLRVLEEAKRRLTGGVSIPPPPSKIKGPQQGNRKTKKDWYNYFYNKRWD